MPNGYCAVVFSLTALALLLSVNTGFASMAEIPAGEFRPLYLQQDGPLVEVESFSLDRLPVTNREYLVFVDRNPSWQKDRVPAVFADSRYLQHWQKSTDGHGWKPDSAMLDFPIVNVSWFAANSYCRSLNKVLPSVAQWEYVARASESNPEGWQEPGYRQKILNWYAHHGQPQNSPVGLSAANYWGIYDLHGMIWEWTMDFNSALVSGESRADSNIDKKLYCAAGTVNAADPSDYAAFMRYAFRSSLSAGYAMPNLGFRCAASGTN